MIAESDKKNLPMCDVKGCSAVAKFMYPDDTAATDGICVCGIHAEPFESVNRACNKVIQGWFR